MRESTHMKRVSARYAALFFVVFGLIFAALGIFVYQTVNANIFHFVDQQILMVGDDSEIDFATNTDATTSTEAEGASGSDEDGSATDSTTESAPIQDAVSEGSSDQIIENSIEENPQTILLERTSDGSIVNTFGIYSTYPHFFEKFPFDPTMLNEAYLTDQNGHHYRAANFRIKSGSDNPTYLQALVNVDSEIAILEQFTVTLIVGLVVALVFSAGASYLLSRKTLKPIAEAWEKQTEFVQNASHELRTPLTVIRTTQELLLEEPNARIVDKFEDINVTIEEARRLSRLTEDLLALTTADADAGEGENKQTEVDLAELAAVIASAYEDLAIVQGKTLHVSAENRGLVWGNTDKLRQLVAILLDNALKYTEEDGTVCVSVETPGSSVVVRVSDDGVGVSDEDLKRVFDRFYRADKARSRETGGNGLGLSIAKSIMDAHGGSIKMERNPTRGVSVIATFKATTR